MKHSKATKDRKTAKRVTVHVPVILFVDGSGKIRFETHGAFDYMVSDAASRKACEGDFWSCFAQGPETPPGDGVQESARMVWAAIELEYPDGADPGRASSMSLKARSGRAASKPAPDVCERGARRAAAIRGRAVKRNNRVALRAAR